MAEQTEVNGITEQESPTVEQEQPEVESSESAEKPEETPDTETDGGQQEDKNWRALREQYEALKKENELLKGEQKPRFETAGNSEVHKPFIAPQDMAQLEFKIFKAQQIIPELDPSSDQYDRLFDTVVAGEYRAALDEYSASLLTGRPKVLPDPIAISKMVKKEWDQRMELTSKKAKDELSQQKQKAVAQKQATVEAEGRSDKRPSPDMAHLRERSRQGDDLAVAERLARSGL